METLRWINFGISILFLLCYAYQFFYIPVPWLKKAQPHAPAKRNRYAVLICARNEAAVIGDLIASLRRQTYDQSLLHIFVMADNCTAGGQGLRFADAAAVSGAGLPRGL